VNAVSTNVMVSSVLSSIRTMCDPDNEVLFNLAQRRDDLPVPLDLGFQNPDVPQVFVVAGHHAAGAPETPFLSGRGS
jgi:hypothetical protein